MRSGLAVVPLAITLNQSRWLRRAAVALLAVHVFTPQGWPFARTESTVPWDLTPLIPNAVSDPFSTFSRIAMRAANGGTKTVGHAAGVARWHRRLGHRHGLGLEPGFSVRNDG